MNATIALLPGDGIGPEVVAAATAVLDALGEFSYTEHAIGGAAIDAGGAPLPDDTLAACRAADAVLLGAVGGPRWDTTDPAAPRPEQGLLGLRRGLGLFANLRPVRPLPPLYDASPLRRERIEGTDLVVVRELTGGIYFGDRGRNGDRAYDTSVYTVAEIERIARTGFRTARSRVTSVDKANVLETSRLWRETVMRVHAAEFPHVALEHLLVDNAAMQLVSAPRHFDVLLTENMFGDILSDEAAMLTGSIGMLPQRLRRGARHARRVRAGPRLGAGHRGDRRGQPARHDPVGRAAPAPRTGAGDGGRGYRIGRRSRPRSGAAHRRPRRPGHDGRGDRGGPGQPRVGVLSCETPRTSYG